MKMLKHSIFTTMRTFLYCVLLLSGGQLMAETSIYRSYDADGNPVFSDEPSAGSESIDIGEVQTVPAETDVKFEYTKRESSKPGWYSGLMITSPGNDEAVRANAGDITVEVKIEPRLRKQDRIKLYLDSQLVEEGSETSFTLTELDRGTHRLYASVFDDKGEELLRSSAVTFHLQRESVLIDSPQGQDPNTVSPLNPPKPPAPGVSPTNPPKPPAPGVSPTNPPKPPAP